MSNKEKNIKIEGEELELNNEETTQNGAEAQAEYANGEDITLEANQVVIERLNTLQVYPFGC